MRKWVSLLVRTVVAAAVVLASASGIDAQPACEDALQQAQKLYEIGSFDEIPEALGPCLTARTSRATAIQVHSLLARAYLYAEEPEQARKEVSTLLRLDSTFEAPSPARFAALVAQVRREEQTTQVASVSKTSESLREAPATVVLVTAEEIRRRGYLDLEQLLHDVPGFDLSRVGGDVYSAVFMRGYRSTGNDRMLLLVDGVEQNDLSSNTLYLSRQYSLSNVDRVEIVYGPSSTMYGANAYTGVISILTRDAEKLVDESKAFAVLGQVTAGGYDSRSVDVTMAGRDRSGTLAWSLAGSVQRSGTRDLSGFDDWDYAYDNLDYRGLMTLTGFDAESFIGAGLCAEPSPYFQCVGDIPFQRAVLLTAEGETLVRELDRSLVRENGLGFDDRAENWSINGKLRISNLTLGLQAWRSQEGIASAYRAGTITGQTTWAPRQTALYLKYSIPLDKVQVNVFGRYVQNSIERDSSRFDYLHSYASRFLSIWSLVAPCAAPLDPLPIGCAPAPAWIEQVSFGSLSSQVRSELNLAYQPSEKLSAVAGVELAKSVIQSQLDQTATGPGALFSTSLQKPEQIEHTDLAVFAQGSYKLGRSLKFVLAGRLTHNEINNKPGATGFGTLFTPRAAVIYSPGTKRLVLKAIYSEAFKDPNDAQKFGVLRFVNEFPSGGLKPEQVRNIELSAGWEPIDSVSTEAAVYQARYTDVVSFGFFPDCQQFVGCLQFQNRDDIRIRGLQLTGRYRHRWGEISGNYTHTEPFQVNPTDLLGAPLLDEQGERIAELRVADIAGDRLNVGIDTHWRERLSAGVRVNYVGERRTGAGTTEPRSPFLRTDAHTTADVTVTYRGPRNTTMQLIAQNVLDEQYFDPGADFQIGAPRIPQAGRTIYLRLGYGLSLRGGGDANRN